VIKAIERTNPYPKGTLPFIKGHRLFANGLLDKGGGIRRCGWWICLWSL